MNNETGHVFHLIAFVGFRKLVGNCKLLKRQNIIFRKIAYSLVCKNDRVLGNIYLRYLL
jgi:hypothetical protein